MLWSWESWIQQLDKRCLSWPQLLVLERAYLPARMLDMVKVRLVRDLAPETMDTWVLLAIIKARVKLRSMETADMDLQLLDKVVVVMEGGRLKGTMDKAVDLVKTFTMHPKHTTVKAEDTGRLLPKTHMPKTMCSMELQSEATVEGSLKGNTRTISTQTMGGHFLHLIASILPTHHDHWDQDDNTLIDRTLQIICKVADPLAVPQEDPILMGLLVVHHEDQAQMISTALHADHREVLVDQCVPAHPH